MIESINNEIYYYGGLITGEIAIDLLDTYGFKSVQEFKDSKINIEEGDKIKMIDPNGSSRPIANEIYLVEAVYFDTEIFNDWVIDIRGESNEALGSISEGTLIDCWCPQKGTYEKI